MNTEKMREEYKKIDGWDATLEPCPFCGSPAELWEYSPSEHYYQKVVMCSNSGDEDRGREECPLYMPPQGFYKATKIEARNIWNDRQAARAGGDGEAITAICRQVYPEHPEMNTDWEDHNPIKIGSNKYTARTLSDKWEVEAVYASPPAPAAKVDEKSGPFELLMRDICEQEPFDPDHERAACVDYDWLYERIKQACSEYIAPAAKVPEGWKLVPVEPTQAMVMAAAIANEESDLHSDDEYEDRLWSAMLSAAPTPEGQS